VVSLRFLQTLLNGNADTAALYQVLGLSERRA